MKRMNYKNFKKVHEDANSATLQHPEGHTIRIAKGPLSDHIKKQLGALQFADGGEVAATKDENGHWIPKEQPHDTNRVNSISGATESYKAEKVHSSDESVISKPIQPNNDRAVPEAAKKVLGYADGGPVEEHGGMSMPNGQELQPSEEQAAPNMAAQMASMQLPSSAPQGPTNVVVPQTAPQTSSIPQQPNYVEQGMQSQLSGISGQAKAEGQLGKEEAASAKENTNKLQQLDALHAENQHKIQSELDNVIHDYSQGKIDPNHFWNSRSTLGKASTAIGLILGGMGAGLTGGPNPALEFLNKQIDRDVEGQHMEAGRKMNMITALQHQLGNNIDATNMAKSMQAGVFASKLMEEAAKSKDPMAMSRAQQAAGTILATYGPLVQQTALRQTMLKGMSTGSVGASQAIPYIVPKEHQNEAFKEVQKAENAAKAIKTVSDTMDQIDKIQSGSNRVYNPIQSRSQVNALNLQIAGLGKEIFGRLNEQELKMLADNHINLTDDAKSRAIKKQNIINMMSKDVSHPTLDAYGIKINKAPQFHK